MITKMNFINRKNYMKYDIFEFEVGVSKKCIYIQEKTHIFYNLLGFKKSRRCLQSSFGIFPIRYISYLIFKTYSLLFLNSLSPVLIVFKHNVKFSVINLREKIQKLAKKLHKFTKILVSLISSLYVYINWP